MTMLLVNVHHWLLLLWTRCWSSYLSHAPVIVNKFYVIRCYHVTSANRESASRRIASYNISSWSPRFIPARPPRQYQLLTGCLVTFHAVLASTSSQMILHTIGWRRPVSILHHLSAGTVPHQYSIIILCRVGQKSKPGYFCNNFVYCQPIAFLAHAACNIKLTITHR